jgi:hypothetical protein
VQEALLDYRVITELRRLVLPALNTDLSRTERLELLVALLCGNFELDESGARARIHSGLIPTNSSNFEIQVVKSHLNSVMNAQAAFGSTLGTPALFFPWRILV